MSEKNNNELAVNEGFAVLANQNVLNEALAEDCQGLEFSFDRVKLPAGGGTAFELPSAESDETEMVKDITGVIVYNHPAYAYYHDKYTGGNNPPDCGSFDGVTGIGNPGGNCADCPYNKFGSGSNADMVVGVMEEKNLGESLIYMHSQKLAKHRQVRRWLLMSWLQ